MILLSYGLLATALSMVVTQNLFLFVGLVSVQALLLGVQSAWFGWEYSDPALYWAAVLTIAIKGVVIPLFLRRLIRAIRVLRVIDSLFSTKVTLLFAIGLTLVAYYATASLPSVGGADGESLPVAVTMVLIGLFLMISRRIALTQVLGFLVIENGLFLAALSSTGGLPVLVDVGIFFDVLVGAMVMGVLIYRINATFESIDTSELRRLRG